MLTMNATGTPPEAPPPYASIEVPADQQTRIAEILSHVIEHLADELAHSGDVPTTVDDVILRLRGTARAATEVRDGHLSPTAENLAAIARAAEYVAGPIADHERDVARGGDGWPEQHTQDVRDHAALLALRDQLAAAGAPFAIDVAVNLLQHEAHALALGVQYDSLGDHLAGIIQDHGAGSLLHHEGLTPATLQEWRMLVEDFAAALRIGEQLFAAVQEGRGLTLRADRAALLELLKRLQEDYTHLSDVYGTATAPALADGARLFATIEARVIA